MASIVSPGQRFKEPSVPNAGHLFVLAQCALFTAAFNFSMRAAIATGLKIDLFDRLSPLGSAQMTGAALGIAFLGFAITLFVTSPLLNQIGIGRLLLVASASFVVGPVLIALADGAGAYRTVWCGMLLCGVGWGCTESAINPMTAAIYPGDKTHRMNVLHAWWPAGLVCGGLVGVLLGDAGISWRWLIMLTAIPAVVIGFLVVGQRFPLSESASLGVSTPDMLREVVRRPTFFIWFALMFLTAATELAPGQWVDIALTQLVGMRGILLLVFVSSIMFVMRHFAGPLVGFLTPIGLLLVSSILALIGLLMLSAASSPATALAAAAVWGAGVCFLWPTMLATVAERFPRGGPWAIGLMGSAGALSIYFVLPQLGSIFDASVLKSGGGADGLAALQPAQLALITARAARESFRTIAVFPAVLSVAFGILFALERSKVR